MALWDVFSMVCHSPLPLGCKVLCYPSTFNMTTGPAHWEILVRSRYTYYWSSNLALFIGPAQLFIVCSTEKWGEPGIFSHMSMT